MSKWIEFLRQYGPIARNVNMYDETIQRSARKQGIVPIEFEHPFQERVVNCFNHNTTDPVSVILTGTAGDGKTHLCRQVWKAFKGNEEDWASDNPYLTITFQFPKDKATWPKPEEKHLLRPVKVHFIRDLSGWAPQQGGHWDPEKQKLLQMFCQSMFRQDADEVFLIAANDGQLIEAFRRLNETEYVKRAQRVFEDLLLEDKQEQSGVRLKFFNLSRSSSPDLFDRAVNKLLGHPGWDELKQAGASENELFGARCPIRHNYELLSTSLVQVRLRALLELLDYNGLHVPIRQILLLLTNAVLGHPDVRDHLMVPSDVPRVIEAGSVSRASLYNNIFGGNLPEIRRQGITIFDFMEQFQIGYETSNRVDNLLIFGQHDENFSEYFDKLVKQDTFYGADDNFYTEQREYIEGMSEDDQRSNDFLQMLVSQRRGLFFRIPKELEVDFNPWELTVFKFAGEYLASVVEVLKRGDPVKRPILSRLVKGLNRVFTGMLLSSDRELCLATSGNYSQAKVCRILVERVSVEPSKGEKVILRADPDNGRVLLSVFFAPDNVEEFNLTLVRYEFLSRIAVEGALPASFSKECYEDLLAFKSQLISAYMARQSAEGQGAGNVIGINVLSLNEQGMPDPSFLEITP